jgi:hypothetical protein
VKNTITRCGEFLRLWVILTSGRTRDRFFTLGVIKDQAPVSRLSSPTLGDVRSENAFIADPPFQFCTFGTNVPKNDKYQNAYPPG